MMNKEEAKRKKREAFKKAKPKSFYSKKMQEMAEQTDMHLRAAPLPDQGSEESTRGHKKRVYVSKLPKKQSRTVNTTLRQSSTENSD
jgi:hypothetical protein